MATNTVPGISALQCVISSLRDTAHLSDEGGELTDQLRELRDWALSTAAQPPAGIWVPTELAERVQVLAEPVAWMTYDIHGAQMVWTDYEEACVYCDDDDQPIPLYMPSNA